MDHKRTGMKLDVIVEHVDWDGSGFYDADDRKSQIVGLYWDNVHDKVIFQYEGRYIPPEHRHWPYEWEGFPIAHGCFSREQYEKGIEELREKGECLIEGEEGCSIKLIKADKDTVYIDFRASSEREELCSIKMSAKWDIGDLVLLEEGRTITLTKEQLERLGRYIGKDIDVERDHNFHFVDDDGDTISGTKNEHLTIRLEEVTESTIKGKLQSEDITMKFIEILAGHVTQTNYVGLNHPLGLRNTWGRRYIYEISCGVEVLYNAPRFLLNGH